MKRRYKIHEVAELLGISTSAIRYYEKKGLISSQKDPQNGYRMFDEYDIYKLWCISYHREFALSVEDIHELRQSRSLEDVESLVERQREGAIQRVEKEQRRLYAWDYYRRLLERCRWEQMPPRLADTGGMHVFRREHYYDKSNTIFSFANLLFSFPAADAPGEGQDYCMLYDEDMQYVKEEDKALEVDYIPPFKGYVFTASFSGDFDEKRALTMALDAAEKHGFAVKPPFYAIYLMSVGSWEDAVRYYEVMMPADI